MCPPDCGSRRRRNGKKCPDCGVVYPDSFSECGRCQVELVDAPVKALQSEPVIDATSIASGKKVGETSPYLVGCLGLLS